MPAIVVLCLSKRRKTIKFPINFTVFQILELVCQREQLNPDQYTLRSNNGVLDNTLQWTFTNLPNNAKLELCALSTDSKELKPVDIALQLENGERLQSNFQPTCTLFDVFQHFKSKIKRSCDFENMIPVIVYMRQEIFGEDVFLKTTLSGLGIVSGRALLRLMFKAGNYELAQPQTLPMHPISLQETVNQTDERVSNTQFKVLGKSTISDAISTRTQSSSASEEFQETSGSNVCLNYGNEVKEDLNKSSTSLVNSDLQVSKMHDDAKLENPNTNRLSKLSEPCDRQPVLFHSSSIKHPCDVELAEDFFDVTVMDLRKMIADLKRQQSREEDLLVGAQRNKKRISAVNKHPKILIRIVFPTRHVLQGWFRPLETVSALYDFVSQHITVCGFYLFIAPPKKILSEMDKTLFDCDLSPASKLLCGFKDKTLLVSDFLDYTSLQLSRFDDANNAVSRIYSHLQQFPDEQT